MHNWAGTSIYIAFPLTAWETPRKLDEWFAPCLLSKWGDGKQKTIRKTITEVQKRHREKSGCHL
jgi:hypothetical protein